MSDDNNSVWLCITYLYIVVYWRGNGRQKRHFAVLRSVLC